MKIFFTNTGMSCFIIFVMSLALLSSPAHAKWLMSSDGTNRFVSGPAKETLSDKAQISLNKGLDAVKAQDWYTAVNHFKDVIETAISDTWLDYEYTDENYQKFSHMIPSYVFYNLALASDKYKESPLSTAMYYRAFLAYDPETDKRRTIQKRIRELEKEHLQYIYPLCDAAEARMGMIGYVGAASEGDAIAANCIMSLIAIGETGRAKEIEKRYRKGYFNYFSDSCSDPVFIDIGYAMGYREIGKDSDFKRSEARVKDAGNVIDPKCGNSYAYRVDYLTQMIGSIDEDRTHLQKRLENKEWHGGNTAQAVDWVVATSWAEYLPEQYLPTTLCLYQSPYIPDKLPNPLINLGGYMAVRDYDPIDKKVAGNDKESNHYPYIAQHNTCSARLMALYWIKYQRNVKVWEKRAGNQMK